MFPVMQKRFAILYYEIVLSQISVNVLEASVLLAIAKWLSLYCTKNTYSTFLFSIFLFLFFFSTGTIMKIRSA